MPLRSFQPGPKYHVYVYVPAGPDIESKVEAWMRELPDQARQSFAATIKLHADDGPLRNAQKSRSLNDEIFEFKCRTGPGYRILWFYLPGHRTVLTHGFTKGAKLPAEIARAKAIKSAIEAEEKT